MSTFPGTVPELPGIGIDRFDQPVRDRATLFFLSHCHVDHMQGLPDAAPLPGPLYVSPHTAVIVGLRHPQHTLVPVPVREQLNLTVRPPAGPAYELCVRTVPAEHCPGSVMFYFETKTVRLLYTGDFRLSPASLTAIARYRVRPTIVYLDSTFLDRRYAYFPPRQASMDRIVELCSRWLAQDRRNVVALWPPASYGSEELFCQLAGRLHQRIHVYAAQREPYNHFAALDEVFTDDAAGARIHACRGKTLQHEGACRAAKPEEKHPDFVMTIRPTARRWCNLRPGEPFWQQGSGNLWYVCYSSHASSTELVEFLRSLQPDVRDIRFSVVADELDRAGKETLLRALLEPAGNELVPPGEEPQRLHCLPLGAFKPKAKLKQAACKESDSETEGDHVEDDELHRRPMKMARRTGSD
uniref:Protein artemis n=1 Tax=Anopheles quadriannulatus TaxID=34691 RepID=A0A182WW49_ANOQN